MYNILVLRLHNIPRCMVYCAGWGPCYPGVGDMHSLIALFLLRLVSCILQWSFYILFIELLFIIYQLRYVKLISFTVRFSCSSSSGNCLAYKMSYTLLIQKGTKELGLKNKESHYLQYIFIHWFLLKRDILLYWCYPKGKP